MLAVAPTAGQPRRQPTRQPPRQPPGCRRDSQLAVAPTAANGALAVGGGSSGCRDTQHEHDRARRPTRSRAWRRRPTPIDLITLIRRTMLQSAPVLAGRVVFRFVVGEDSGIRAANLLFHPAVHSASIRPDLHAIRDEQRLHRDVLRVDALDGPVLDKQCSCGEKQWEWLEQTLAGQARTRASRAPSSSRRTTRGWKLENSTSTTSNWMETWVVW